MSVHRQVIEANALRYLAETPAIRDLFALEFPRMKIPHLIHHNTTANVLWIADLGESQTLSEFLATSPANAREIAVMLGTFVARLWEITAHPAPETLALFEHADGEGAPVDFLVSTALAVLSRRGVPDAEVLSDRIRTAMEDKEKLEPCLSMVDFWPENFLIGADENLGLVDWEYFGLSTPGAEVGMFAARLQLLIFKSKNKPAVVDATRTFISAFFTSYAAVRPPSTYFQRQALIAYGRELVTAIEFSAADLDDEAQGQVLDVGVRSLRAAGSSEAEVNATVADLFRLELGKV